MVTRVSGGIITDQMLTGSLRYFEIDGGVNAFADTIGDGNQRAVYATVADGGSGYALNDVLTLGGTTAGTAATFTVTQIGPSGEVISVSSTLAGSMSTVDTNPVATTVAPAGGTGATLNVTYTSLIQIPNYTENGQPIYVGVNAPVPASAAEQVLEVISQKATIVQIALVSDDLIQVAVENTGFGWVVTDNDLRDAIRALGAAVVVPDTTATGTTVDLSAATVTEKLFSAGLA